MARARNIKPGFFKNYDLADLGPAVQLLFAGLWCLADRDGKLEDKPRLIKAEIFPYYETDVNGGLTELQRLKFIDRYVSENIAVIKIKNFTKHQSPHNTEKASNLPDEETVIDYKPHETKDTDGNGCLTVNPPLDNAGNRPDSLIHRFTDSLIPDSTTSSILDEPQKKKPVKKSTQIPEDFIPNETGEEYAKKRKLDVRIELQSFINWHRAKGSLMKDWQAAWRTWCDKAVEFGRSRDSPARQTAAEKRAQVIAELTGRNNGYQHPERDITAESQCFT